VGRRLQQGGPAAPRLAGEDQRRRRARRRQHPLHRGEVRGIVLAMEPVFRRGDAAIAIDEPSRHGPSFHSLCSLDASPAALAGSQRPGRIQGRRCYGTRPIRATDPNMRPLRSFYFSFNNICFRLSGSPRKEKEMSQDPRIEHIVVLMLENASFDHVLGFLKADNPKIDGLTGTEANPADGSQAGSPSVPVTKAALNSTPLDGGHDLVDVNDQLFSTEKPATGAKAANLGFVKNYTKQAKGSLTIGKRIMDCFDPTNVPVLARLAQEFAVCDRWFSSVPGPTWPTRLFVHPAA